VFMKQTNTPVVAKLSAHLSTLLENRLKAPVAKGLWYRFFEPVPSKWYQRPKAQPLVPGKTTGA